MVKLSARGEQPKSESALARWHHDVERHLKQSGLAWTMPRPHVVMQTLLDQAERIQTLGEIRAASGEGRIPFIDIRDIADAAAAVLTETGHEGKTYSLTGGVALDYNQVADSIGAAIGKEVDYIPERFDEIRIHLQDEGRPDWLVESRLALASCHRAGQATAHLTREVAALTGHPPRSVVQFAYDHRTAFTSPETGAPASSRRTLGR